MAMKPIEESTQDYPALPVESKSSIASIDELSSEYDSYEDESSSDVDEDEFASDKARIFKAVCSAAENKDKAALDDAKKNLHAIDEDLNFCVKHANGHYYAPMTHLAMYGKVEAVNFLDAYSSSVNDDDAVLGYAIALNENEIEKYDTDDFLWPLIHGLALGSIGKS